MKKSLKIFLIIFISLVTILLVSSVVINNIIEKKVENFLATRMPENIAPTYKTLTIDLLSGTISLDSVSVSIKNKSDDVMHTQVSLTALIVENVSYIDYLFKNEIHIEDIKVKNPSIVYYKDKLISIKDSNTVRTKPVKLFKPVLVDELKIYDANIHIYDSTKDSLFLYSKDLTVEIRDILLNDSIVSERLPVHFEKYKASADSVFVKVSPYENLTVEDFSIDKRKAIFNNLKLKTKYSKRELSRLITKERDHFDLTIQSFLIDDIDFGFVKNQFFAKSKKVTLETPILDIYRDKLVADDLKPKPLYSKMLRELPFSLTVDSMEITDAKIKYEERQQAENMGGSINFDKLNAKIANISNTYKSPNKTTLDITANFMEEAPIKVDWSFDVQNEQDQFLFKADVGSLNTNKINTFTEPNIKVRLQGRTNKTYFTIDGNSETSRTDLKMNFSDFKVTILKKDGKTKNKFLSGIANLFVSKDSSEQKDNYREGSAEATRDKTKSVFNFIWTSVKNALVNIMI